MCFKEIQMQGHCRYWLLYFVLLLLNCLNKGTDASLFQKIHNLAAQKDFSTNAIIKPQIYESFSMEPHESTLNIKTNQHFPKIVLSYIHKGQLVHLDLNLYHELLPDEHFLKLQSSSNASKYIIKNFSKTEDEFCHYQGSIRNKPHSRAAISTCDGVINGIVFEENDVYIIHTERKESKGWKHFLIGASDLRNQNGSCGHQRVYDDIYTKSALRKKRSFDEDYSLHSPFQSNKQSLYVELVIVIDNSLYKFFGKDLGRAHQYCKDVANIVNALYSQLNIFVVLTGVVVWSERDEIEFHSNAREMLHRFLEYRQVELSPDHPNDHAQMLTKFDFDNNVVGKAFVGPMCSADKSGSVCVAHSDITAVVANTMAHEMGHTLGMSHDDSSCKCLDKKCIMSDTSSSYIPTKWSSCSIESLNEAFSRGKEYCLRNKPKRQLASPMCGNGIVEPDEECDCGLPEFCYNKCCNPKTCRLMPNAICGSGECCNLKKCQLKKPGSVCRLANDECDLTEFCTGESEFCPKDVFKHDTADCNKGLGYCYQGVCGSHEVQCRILWGTASENSPHCYAHANNKGDHTGNCGGNPITMEFTKCAKEHAQCGRLQCTYPRDWEKFGISIGAIQTSTSYALYKRNYVECHSALFNLGVHTPDPGMTPNGAKCGENGMCFEQKCVPIDDLRNQGIGQTCPEDCNGNGICNSQGNCHCFIGFGGSSCRLPGSGGSIESGPATNPNSHDTFQRFLYIFFCGVIPFAITFVLLFYFCGRRAVYKRRKFNNDKNLPDLGDISIIIAEDRIKSNELIGKCNESSPKSSETSKSSQKSREGEISNSEESLNRNGMVSLEASLQSVDVRNVQKVAESVEHLNENQLRNSLIAKCASNYELSTLSDSTNILENSNQKVTPVRKKPYNSSMALANRSKKGSNNNLKPKLEITQVRLQSSTNPLAVALSSGAALIGNNSLSTDLNTSRNDIKIDT